MLYMPTVLPPYIPPDDFKAIQGQRDQNLARQMALTQSGGSDGTIEVPQTTNPDANKNLVTTAEILSRNDKLLAARGATGGMGRGKQSKRQRNSRKTRRTKNRRYQKRRRLFSARKYI